MSKIMNYIIEKEQKKSYDYYSGIRRADANGQIKQNETTARDSASDGESKGWGELCRSIERKQLQENDGSLPF
jgi:hypothetical protein